MLVQVNEIVFWKIYINRIMLSSHFLFLHWWCQLILWHPHTFSRHLLSGLQKIYMWLNFLVWSWGRLTVVNHVEENVYISNIWWTTWSMSMNVMRNKDIMKVNSFNLLGFIDVHFGSETWMTWMIQCGSCLSLQIVSDDDGTFPLQHVTLTCAQWCRVGL